VVANLEADAARLRDEVDVVAAELTAIGPEADELTAQEEAFAAERRTVLSTLNEVTSGATTASAAARAARAATIRKLNERGSRAMRASRRPQATCSTGPSNSSAPSVSTRSSRCWSR
jgi:predicted deacylase